MFRWKPSRLLWLVPAQVVLTLTYTSAGASSSSAGFQTGSPHSTVQSLTEETFQRAIQDSANSLWLLEFYAPWCGHCKRLAPVLDEVAPLVAGKMAVGKIDCVVQKKLCNQFDVRGYPTLKLSRDGQVSDFLWGRTKDDFLAFAKKMSGSPVSICATHDDALQLASTTADGVVFVAHDPDAKGGTRSEKLQSTLLTRVLQQVARMEQAHAIFCLASPTADVTKFGRNNNDNSVGGFIAKVEAGVPPIFFKNELTVPNLLQFVKEYNVPLVAELGPANFHKIGRNGKRLVIGAVANEREEMEAMKKVLMDYALTSNNNNNNNAYYFGWMNGKKWYKFLQQFNIQKLPQIFVLDVPQKIFWQDDSYNTNNIQDFLRAVESGEIPEQTAGRKKPTTGIKGTIYQMESLFLQYVPWSVAALIAIIALLLIFILPKPDELRPPYTMDKKKKMTTAPKDAMQETTITTNSTNELTTTTTMEEEESKKEK